MRVTRHLPAKQILFDYTLHQQKLEQVQSAKYLGIIITDNLDWGQHVSEISCKATMTMGFLRCNLALAPRHTKEVAYKTLVRPLQIVLVGGYTVFTLPAVRLSVRRNVLFPESLMEFHQTLNVRVLLPFHGYIRNSRTFP